MKKYLEILLCVLLLAVLYSVAYAEWEGYMIINPDRNLFTDDKLSGIMGHFEEQSIVYAKNKGGINMYEVLFTTIGEVGGTEYTKAYVVIAEPKVLSAAKAAEYRQILESRGAHKVDGIPLPSAEVNPEPAEQPDKYGTIQMSGTAVISVSETNIRKGPDSKKYNTYGVYQKNTELPVFGYVVDKNGETWYKVREPENKNLGFIMEKYVKLKEKTITVDDAAAEEIIEAENAVPMTLLMASPMMLGVTSADQGKTDYERWYEETYETIEDEWLFENDPDVSINDTHFKIGDTLVVTVKNFPKGSYLGYDIEYWNPYDENYKDLFTIRSGGIKSSTGSETFRIQLSKKNNFYPGTYFLSIGYVEFDENGNKIFGGGANEGYFIIDGDAPVTGYFDDYTYSLTGGEKILIKANVSCITLPISRIQIKAVDKNGNNEKMVFSELYEGETGNHDKNISVAIDWDEIAFNDPGEYELILYGGCIDGTYAKLDTAQIVVSEKIDDNPVIPAFSLTDISFTTTNAPVTVSWEQATFPTIAGFHPSYVIRWYGPGMPNEGKAFTTTDTSYSISAEFTGQSGSYAVEVYAVMLDDAGNIAIDANGNAVQQMANGDNIVDLSHSNPFLTTPVLSPDVVWIGDQAIISVVTNDQVAYLKSVNNNGYVSDEKFDFKAENGRITWTRPTRPESTDTGRTWTCIAYNAAGEEIGRSAPSNPITVYSKPTVVASPSAIKKGETITFTVFAPGKTGTVKLETEFNGSVYPVGAQQALNANGQATITHSFSSAGENREIRAYINGEYFGSVFVTVNDEERIEPETEQKEEQVVYSNNSNNKGMTDDLKKDENSDFIISWYDYIANSDQKVTWNYYAEYAGNNLQMADNNGVKLLLGKNIDVIDPNDEKRMVNEWKFYIGKTLKNDYENLVDECFDDNLAEDIKSLIGKSKAIQKISEETIEITKDIVKEFAKHGPRIVNRARYYGRKLEKYAGVAQKLGYIMDAIDIGFDAVESMNLNNEEMNDFYNIYANYVWNCERLESIKNTTTDKNLKKACDEIIKELTDYYNNDACEMIKKELGTRGKTLEVIAKDIIDLALEKILEINPVMGYSHMGGSMINLRFSDENLLRSSSEAYKFSVLNNCISDDVIKELSEIDNDAIYFSELYTVIQIYGTSASLSYLEDINYTANQYGSSNNKLNSTIDRRKKVLSDSLGIVIQLQEELDNMIE